MVQSARHAGSRGSDELGPCEGRAARLADWRTNFCDAMARRIGFIYSERARRGAWRMESSAGDQLTVMAI